MESIVATNHPIRGYGVSSYCGRDCLASLTIHVPQTVSIRAPVHREHEHWRWQIQTITAIDCRKIKDHEAIRGPVLPRRERWIRTKRQGWSFSKHSSRIVTNLWVPCRRR